LVAKKASLRILDSSHRAVAEFHLVVLDLVLRIKRARIHDKQRVVAYCSLVRNHAKDTFVMYLIIAGFPEKQLGRFGLRLNVYFEVEMKWVNKCKLWI
jgi:hypothetical protein